MKISKLFSALMLTLALLFAACDPAPIPVGPVNPDPDDTTKVEPVTDAIESTVAEVIEIANALEAGASTKEYYKVWGVVSAVATSEANLVSYGNINFTLTDGDASIGCYYINYLNNEPFKSADDILEIGDTIVVISQLKSYVNKNTQAVTPEMANGYIFSIVRNQREAQVIDADFAQIISVKNELGDKQTTLDSYRVKGVVSSVSTAKDKLVSYGNCNFNIKDPTGAVTDEIICYYTNWLENKPFTKEEDIPVIGDTVVVVGPVQNYSNKAELYKGYIESIVRYIAPPIVPDDDSNLDVPAGTITCAEALAIGERLNENDTTNEVYFIKGIVLSMTSSQSAIEQYGNVIFTMADAVDAENVFTAYCVYGKDSASIVDAQQVVPGNVVVVKSPIMKFSKDGKVVVETPQNLGYIYSTTNTFVPSVIVEPEVPEGTKQEIDLAANALQLTKTDTIADSKEYTLGEVKLTINKGSSTSKPLVMTNMYRMYKNSNFVVSVPDGKVIKYIAVSAASDYGVDRLAVEGGEFTVVKQALGVWTGSANAVTFTNNNQVRITKLVIVYD